VSEEQRQVEAILAAINNGEAISNDDARVLAGVIDSLDFAFRVQSTVNNVMVETIPAMVGSLGASVLSRAGRTDQKIKKSVQKICDEHVVSLMGMVTNLAANMIDLAEKGAQEQEETE
tara:strand:- start:1308 stop:1661 length:354 start_codon:yes stop_codon:yes gene_type:complete